MFLGHENVHISWPNEPINGIVYKEDQVQKKSFKDITML